MNKYKKVKLYSEDMDEWFEIEEWEEIPDNVEISYVTHYGETEEVVKLPALSREEFEDLVKATRYVMGWEDE